MNDFNKEIGNRIYRLRKNLNLSREELSELSDISDRFIYDIETGQKGMSAATLMRISKSLKVTSDYILFGNENESDVSFVTEILKTFDKDNLESAEKILIEFSKAVMKIKEK